MKTNISNLQSMNFAFKLIFVLLPILFLFNKRGFQITNLKNLLSNKPLLTLGALIIVETTIKSFTTIINGNLNLRSLIFIIYKASLLPWLILFASYINLSVFYTSAVLLSFIINLGALLEYIHLGKYIPFIESDNYFYLWNQVSSFFSNANILGAFTVTCSILTLETYTKKRYKFLKLIYITQCLTVLVSGSRASIALLIVSQIALFTKVFKCLYFKKSSLALIIKLLVTMIVSFGYMNVDLNLREVSWKGSLQLLMDNPLGIGVNNFDTIARGTNYFNEVKFLTLSTNSWLWTLIIENGVFAIIILCLIFTILYRVDKRSNNKFKSLALTTLILTQAFESHIEYVPIIALLFFIIQYDQLQNKKHQAYHNNYRH